MEWTHEVVSTRNSVRSLAVLPGKIAFDAMNEVRVLDLKTGDIQSLRGHTGSIWCLAALPDGRIASGSRDKTVRVWDAGEYTTLEHPETVWCLAVLPDGRLASGCADGGVRVWDVDTGEHETLEGHSSDVYCLDAFPDGVVSGSGDTTVKVWDLAGGVRTHTRHTKRVSCVLALPDSIVSSSWDQSVVVWSAGGVRTLSGPEWDLSCLSRLPDGRVVAGSDYGTIKVWDPARDTPEVTLKGTLDEAEAVTCVAALPDGRFASGSTDRSLKVWEWKAIDVNRFKPIVRLGHKTFPSGTRLFTLITSETFDRSRDLAFFGKHLGLNVRATLHNTRGFNKLWLHVFNTTAPLRMLTTPRWRHELYGDQGDELFSVLEKRLAEYCRNNGYDGWHMRVFSDNSVAVVEDAEYETVILHSSFDKLQFRGKRMVTLEELKDKDHVRVRNGRIIFVKRIERLEEMFENLRF